VRPTQSSPRRISEIAAVALFRGKGYDPRNHTKQRRSHTNKNCRVRVISAFVRVISWIVGLLLMAFFIIQETTDTQLPQNRNRFAALRLCGKSHFVTPTTTGRENVFPQRRKSAPRRSPRLSSSHLERFRGFPQKTFIRSIARRRNLPCAVR
jgi:hypothetical protein